MTTDIENIAVIYEDNHIIAVNKRAGDIVQGDKTGDTPLSEIVKAYLKKKYSKPGKFSSGWCIGLIALLREWLFLPKLLKP